MDLTIKKSNGTTDIVWTQTASAVADGTPAVFTSKTAHSLPIGQPTFSMKTAYSSNRTARRARLAFEMPIVAEVNGRTQRVGTIPFEFGGLLPTDQPSAVTDEAVDQFINLLASPSIRTALKVMLAPR